MKPLNTNVALAFICVAHIHVSTANAQERKVTRIQMTAIELSGQGIAVRGTAATPFPNSCQSSGNVRLSVSNRLLEHFKAQGFTLESLCLGLSSNIRFDPETGRQLPLAYVAEIRRDQKNEFPLNLPPCFRNAVPYLECKNTFHTYWGSRWEERERIENSRFWQQFDATVRQEIQKNPIYGVYKFQDISRVFKAKASSEIEWLLSSTALPRGYGYALHGPEGEDPEVENVNPGTYRVKPDRARLWSD